jgi:hypothetical protein
LQHELGHLIAGLFDEYALDGSVALTRAGGEILRANCSSVQPAPHWAGVPNVRFLPGCALYPNVYHPFDTCRMGTHGREFCPICDREMRTELLCLKNPDDPKYCSGRPESITTADSRLTPEPILSKAALANLEVLRAGLAFQPASQDASAPLLRMLVRVESATAAPLKIVSATDSTGRHILRNRRIGDYVYEVTENGTVTLGVLPGNPFEIREYSGGINEHRGTPTRSATFLIQIPNVTRAALLSGARNMGIVVYRLRPDAGNEPVTSSRLNEMRAKGIAETVVQLSASQVREQLKGLKPAAP